jgi:hypothetical protein
MLQRLGDGGFFPSLKGWAVEAARRNNRQQTGELTCARVSGTKWAEKLTDLRG